MTFQMLVSYYLLHLASAVSVLVYMMLVSIVAGTVAGFLPVGQFMFVLVVQVGLFLPFCKLYGTYVGKVTKDIRYEWGKGASIGTFVFLHFWSILFTLAVLRGYIMIKSADLSQTLEEQLAVLYQGGVADFSEFGVLFERLLQILVKYPSYLLRYMENLPLKLFAYCCMLFSMVIGLEWSRNKAIEKF